METLLIVPKTEKELIFLKSLLEKLKIKFKSETQEKNLYNPEFVKKIKRARARGNYRVLNPDNIWEGIS